MATATAMAATAMATASTTPPTPTLSATFRTQLTAACARLLREAANAGETTVGVLLSGGVDTSAVVAACRDARGADAALPSVAVGVTVVVSSEEIPEPPDEGFATRVAKEFGLAHHVVRLSPRELVDAHVEPVADALASFDPMTLRNAFVVDAALRKAKQIATTKFWLTGDQADELLGGYSFTWTDIPDAEWRAKRDKLVDGSRYCADELAERALLVCKSPFRDAALVAWAKQHAGRGECLGERRLYLRVDQANAETRLTGKVVLRDAFPELVSSFRRKDPVEVGSGSTVLGRAGFLSWPAAFSTEAQRTHVLDEHGVVLRDAVQATYYAGFTQTRSGSAFAKALGVTRLPHKRNEPGVCSDCLAPLGSVDESFCRVCGAWPAQARQRVGP